MAGPQFHARQYTARLNASEQAAFWSFTSPFRSGPDGPLSIEYERHEPEKTLLHELVRDEFEPFLARARRNGAPVAHFVEREIRLRRVRRACIRLSSRPLRWMRPRPSRRLLVYKGEKAETR